MFEELEQACTKGGVGGFIPAVKQIGNVASLPAIVGVCLCHPLKRQVTQHSVTDFNWVTRYSFGLWLCNWKHCRL